MLLYASYAYYSLSYIVDVYTLLLSNLDYYNTTHTHTHIYI